MSVDTKSYMIALNDVLAGAAVTTSPAGGDGSLGGGADSVAASLGDVDGRAAGDALSAAGGEPAVTSGNSSGAASVGGGVAGCVSF
jgi:hypothetical protein